MARVLGVQSILLSSLHGYRSSWMMRDLVPRLPPLLAIAVPKALATTPAGRYAADHRLLP